MCRPDQENLLLLYREDELLLVSPMTGRQILLSSAQSQNLCPSPKRLNNGEANSNDCVLIVSRTDKRRCGEQGNLVPKLPPDWDRISMLVPLAMPCTPTFNSSSQQISFWGPHLSHPCHCLKEAARYSIIKHSFGKLFRTSKQCPWNVGRQSYKNNPIGFCFSFKLSLRC